MLEYITLSMNITYTIKTIRGTLKMITFFQGYQQTKPVYCMSRYAPVYKIKTK